MTLKRKELLGKLTNGYTEEALRAAFDKVKNPDYWKNPIDAVIEATEDEIAVIKYAIIFYTATEATVTDLGDGWYRIKAKGYLEGPAGP